MYFKDIEYVDETNDPKQHSRSERLSKSKEVYIPDGTLDVGLVKESNTVTKTRSDTSNDKHTCLAPFYPATEQR